MVEPLDLSYNSKTKASFEKHRLIFWALDHELSEIEFNVFLEFYKFI